ncbi:hypothetical protein GCM10010990_37100 [Croceicoccus mobilis]|uniref:Uncharacterized protein n=1 Tax=Croceicoccus mobilis TaxID=1703339 RepID=A0A917DZI2_9SPHN|nr:hypothetical protein GCM10010990_37100 [Croceicoccus mobilis]
MSTAAAAPVWISELRDSHPAPILQLSNGKALQAIVSDRKRKQKRGREVRCADRKSAALQGTPSLRLKGLGPKRADETPGKATGTKDSGKAGLSVDVDEPE